VTKDTYLDAFTTLPNFESKLNIFIQISDNGTLEAYTFEEACQPMTYKYPKGCVSNSLDPRGEIQKS
jgi:hypothetical protein